MNRGALIWFRMIGVMVWNLLIINHFFIEFCFKKPRLKTIFEFKGVLSMVGIASPSLI